MQEIEILIKVSSSKIDTLKALANFTTHGVKRILDIYFVDPLRGDLKPDDTGRLQASFRLRQKDSKCLIAYKMDNFDGNEWVYSDEHETTIGDFETALHIVQKLGLKELVRIDNEKHTFTTPEYEIVFEDVKGLGFFLEVEVLEQIEKKQIVAAKQKIRSFLAKLDLDLGPELNAGKPELMLAKLKKNS